MERATSAAPDFGDAYEVLGTFDPFSMFLQLNYEAGVNQPIKLEGFDFKRFLSRVPVAVLAHELAHFTQAATTGYGLRRFFFGLDLMVANVNLIGTAANEKGGILHAPIMAHLADYWPSGDYPEQFKLSALFTSAISRYMGGMRVPSDSLKSPILPGERPFLRVEEQVTICGYKTILPVFFADLGATKQNQAVSLGALHLEEAFAKSVELVQRHLTDEEGEKADPYADNKSKPSAESQSLLDPYYIVNCIWNEMSKKIGIETNLEEMCAVIDLALMLDPRALSFSSKKDLKNFCKIYGKETLFGDYNPFHTFMQLVGVVSQSYHRLPRLDIKWGQNEITGFQNAVLKAGGFSCNMKELTKATRSFCEFSFNRYRAHTILPPDLYNLYHETFQRLLTWRQKERFGGVILGELLTSPDFLYEFILKTVPTVCVGGIAISPRGGFREGEGVGVDMANILQIREILESMIYQNRPCPRHLDRPRSCPVAAHELCNKITDGKESRMRCAREGALAVAMKWTGIRELRW